MASPESLAAFAAAGLALYLAWRQQRCDENSGVLSQRILMDRELIIEHQSALQKQSDMISKLQAHVAALTLAQNSEPPPRPNEHIAALPTGSLTTPTSIASSSTASAATLSSLAPSPSTASAATLSSLAPSPPPPSPMAALQEELLLRILELLPSSAAMEAERVCTEWRACVQALHLWPEWRTRGAILDETNLSIPGVPSYAFGAPPTELPAEGRAAAARATAQAASLKHEAMELASCSGSQWTVLCMDASGTPSALKQHQARDFMLTCCAASGLVYSGDKEAAVRVWDARTGDLLSRVAFPGSSMSSLAASRGRLLVGDSQGQIYLMTEAGLRRGELDAISWRAHDGKVSSMHARPYDEVVTSGGADGGVRKWSCASVVSLAYARAEGGEQVHVGDNDSQGESGNQRQRRNGGAGGGDSCFLQSGLRAASRVDLGLWAVGEATAIARHHDTVTHVTRDDMYIYSASREGTLLVSTLLGAPHLAMYGVGQVNCLAAARGKLVLCSDDGHHAAIAVWDVPRKTRVQELGGIRKWNAPTSICYIGYDRCFWVRDSQLCTMRWTSGATPAPVPGGGGAAAMAV